MEQNKKNFEIQRELNFLLDMGEKELVLDIGNKPSEPENIEIREEESSPEEQLAAMESELQNCTECKLHSSRNKLVFGLGDPQAKIMFIGEAPGMNEDKTGIPFVGRAGKLLDKIFSAMGLSREKGIYIGNILKCRPPNNRDPESDEVNACIPNLIKQIEIIKPEVICCLGRVAAQNLLDTNLALGKMRGKVHYFHETPVMVTYHPAYLLRNPAGKKPCWEDMKMLLEVAGLPVPKN